jgi:hypothetical protein
VEGIETLFVMIVNYRQLTTSGLVYDTDVENCMTSPWDEESVAENVISLIICQFVCV